MKLISMLLKLVHCVIALMKVAFRNGHCFHSDYKDYLWRDISSSLYSSRNIVDRTGTINANRSLTGNQGSSGLNQLNSAHCCLKCIYFVFLIINKGLLLIDVKDGSEKKVVYHCLLLIWLIIIKTNKNNQLQELVIISAVFNINYDYYRKGPCLQLFFFLVSFSLLRLAGCSLFSQKANGLKLHDSS